MANFRGPSAKRLGAVVLAIVVAAWTFAACGGRTDLATRDTSSSVGNGGSGADGGVAGAIGRDGSLGSGAGGRSGFGGTGFGGVSGSGFGGVGSGFGGSSGSGFGGAGGASFGGVGGGSFGGAAGAQAECRPVPSYECHKCKCASCREDWRLCQENLGCREIIDCVAANGCWLSTCYEVGLCRDVIDRFGGPAGIASLFATYLDHCALRAGCSCAGNSARSRNCACSRCQSEWLACTSASGCSRIAGCFLDSGCFRFGTCFQVCAPQIAEAAPVALSQAQTFVSCSLNANCPCSWGVLGDAGVDGSGGFGGSQGLGGGDGGPD